MALFIIHTLISVKSVQVCLGCHCRSRSSYVLFLFFVFCFFVLLFFFFARAGEGQKTIRATVSRLVSSHLSFCSLITISNVCILSRLIHQIQSFVCYVHKPYRPIIYQYIYRNEQLLSTETTLCIYLNCQYMICCYTLNFNGYYC